MREREGGGEREGAVEGVIVVRQKASLSVYFSCRDNCWCVFKSCVNGRSSLSRDSVKHWSHQFVSTQPMLLPYVCIDNGKWSIECVIIR